MPRTRKIDIELREINKKIKEHNVNVRQFNKDMGSHDQALIRVQNRYFDEMEIE